MSPPPDDADERRFTTLYDEHASRVLLYAARHVGAAHADDVVSDTFTVAWRRLDDVPGEAPLPWLLVVARNVIWNRRRREDTAARFTQESAVLARLDLVAQDVAQEVADRNALLAALAGLTELEREAVLLVGWDGLSGGDAARVAGCTSAAFHVRLHRARRRLERSLHQDEAETRPSAAPRTQADPTEVSP